MSLLPPYFSSISSLLTPCVNVADPQFQAEGPQELHFSAYEEMDMPSHAHEPVRGLQRRVRLVVSDSSSFRQPSSFGVVDPQSIADSTLSQMIDLAQEAAWQELESSAIQTPSLNQGSNPAGSFVTEAEATGAEETVEEALQEGRIRWKDARVDEAFWMAFASVHAEENRSAQPCFWQRVTVAMIDFLPAHLQQRLATVLRKRLTCTHFTNLRRKNSLDCLDQRLHRAQRQLGLPLKALADELGFSARRQARTANCFSPTQAGHR